MLQWQETEEVLERTLSRCWCQVHAALLDVHFPTLLIIVLKQINWKTICSKHTVCHCILLSHQYCTPSEHMVQILHVENTNHPPLEKLSIFQLSVNRWCTVLLAFLLGAIFYQTPWVPFPYALTLVMNWIVQPDCPRMTNCCPPCWNAHTNNRSWSLWLVKMNKGSRDYQPWERTSPTQSWDVPHILTETRIPQSNKQETHFEKFFITEFSLSITTNVFSIRQNLKVS